MCFSPLTVPATFQNFTQRRPVLLDRRGQQQRHLRQRPQAVSSQDGKRAERNRARVGPPDRDDEAALPRSPRSRDLLRMRARNRSGRQEAGAKTRARVEGEEPQEGHARA